jgi:hypothetical protein
MCKVNCVVVICKLDTKRQRKVMTLGFLFHAVLVVANVLACTRPSLAELTGIDVAVHQRPHPVVIQRIWFEEVNDVETVGATCHSV